MTCDVESLVIIRGMLNDILMTGMLTFFLYGLYKFITGK